MAGRIVEVDSFKKGLEEVVMEDKSQEWAEVAPDSISTLEAVILRDIFSDSGVDPQQKAWLPQSKRAGELFFRRGLLDVILRPKKHDPDRSYVVVATPMDFAVTPRKKKLPDNEIGLTLGLEQKLPKFNTRTLHFVTYWGLKSPRVRHDEKHKISRQILVAESPFVPTGNNLEAIRQPGLLKLMHGASLLE